MRILWLLLGALWVTVNLAEFLGEATGADNLTEEQLRACEDCIWECQSRVCLLFFRSSKTKQMSSSDPTSRKGICGIVSKGARRSYGWTAPIQAHRPQQSMSRRGYRSCTIAFKLSSTSGISGRLFSLNLDNSGSSQYASRPAQQGRTGPGTPCGFTWLRAVCTKLR